MIHYEKSYLSILNNGGVETLGVLDVDGLNITVQLLLGALLVVTLAADTNSETEGNTLDTGFPHFLVQLRVEADVFGALHTKKIMCQSPHFLELINDRELQEKSITYHGLFSESANLLDSAGSSLLEGDTMHLLIEGKN